MKAKAAVGIGLLLALLLLGSSVQAMSSAHYKLEWFTPLTGGGGQMSSAHYAANLTIGQTAVGRSASTHYRSGLGYWEGTLVSGRIFLPLTLR
jgi:hypothetical protein